MRRFAAAAVLVLPLAGVAQATWTASATGSANVGSDTMGNATGLTSTCVTGGIKLSRVRSADTYVTAYRITRTVTPSGTVTVLPDQAGTATTYTNSFTATNSSTYSYTIAARIQNWTTSQSASTSRTYSSKGLCSRGGLSP